MSHAPLLTRDGRARLQARADLLRNEVLPALADSLADRHRDPGVLLDNDRVLREVQRLDALLAAAASLDALPDDPCVVELGDLVTLEIDDGTVERVLIVDPAEAALDEVRISAEAPLARAILGRRVGDRVEVVAPAATYGCRILGATRPASAR